MATDSPKPHLLPLSIAALTCWLFALYFPIAHVYRLGLENSGHIIEIGDTFRTQDQLLLGIISDVILVVIPTLVFLAIPAAILPSKNQQLALKFLVYNRSWAMPEVFALSILVAFIKVGSLAEAHLASGFFFLLAAAILLTYLLQALPLQEAIRKKNLSASLAFLVAAGLLLIPANTLPVMTVVKPGEVATATILGGVVSLVEHGFWGIAIIVFIASILVPFGKIGGLIWLISLGPNRSKNPRAAKVYRTIDFIGRWSMLDIFLIGFLATIIDFGRIAFVTPGPAAPAFAAAVILTVIAVERFELKPSL